MPNIITSTLARSKTKDNIKMLNDITMKKTQRVMELNQQFQLNADRDYERNSQIQNETK